MSQSRSALVILRDLQQAHRETCELEQRGERCATGQELLFVATQHARLEDRAREAVDVFESVLPKLLTISAFGESFDRYVAAVEETTELLYDELSGPLDEGAHAFARALLIKLQVLTTLQRSSPLWDALRASES